MNVYIEVHIEGKICYTLKAKLSDPDGPLQNRSDAHDRQIKLLIRYLQNGILQHFNHPKMQCFVLFKSKMNKTHE